MILVTTNYLLIGNIQKVMSLLRIEAFEMIELLATYSHAEDIVDEYQTEAGGLDEEQITMLFCTLETVMDSKPARAFRSQQLPLRTANFGTDPAKLVVSFRE